VVAVEVELVEQVIHQQLKMVHLEDLVVVELVEQTV